MAITGIELLKIWRIFERVNESGAKAREPFLKDFRQTKKRV
jgi:hypothetical protein